MDTFGSLLPQEFIERFFINTIFLLVLLRFVYYGYTRDRDSLFGFFLFGHGVYLVTGLMHEINISMGFAFGLFAVLSMLRYRTESLSIRDMTYLFLVIVVSLMAAVGPIGNLSLALIDTLLILIVWCCETTGFAAKTVRKSVIYDNTSLTRPENRDQLFADLQERLGERVLDVDVRSVDFLRDSAVLRVTLSADSKRLDQRTGSSYENSVVAPPAIHAATAYTTVSRLRRTRTRAQPGAVK